MTQPPPTHDLLAPLAAGRQEAYAALYDRLGGSLFRVALAMLRQRPEAEDAVQDVFVNLVKSRHCLAQVEDLPAYLFACLRHTVFRHLEKKAAEREGMNRLVWQGTAENPEPASANADQDLQTALAALPAEQREIIALKTDAGLTFAQIANVLGVSPNTAASRYRYGLEKLRMLLKE